MELKFRVFAHDLQAGARGVRGGRRSGRSSSHYFTTGGAKGRLEERARR